MSTGPERGTSVEPGHASWGQHRCVVPKVLQGARATNCITGGFGPAKTVPALKPAFESRHKPAASKGLRITEALVLLGGDRALESGQLATRAARVYLHPIDDSNLQKLL
jgi:hypothetical protein